MSHGKGGRRGLGGGAPRFLRRHDGKIGRRYHRRFAALQSEFGPFSELQRLEAGRTAVLGVQLDLATEALFDAHGKRALGRGRRPGAQQVERLARRQGLADGSYSQALDKLKELTAANRKRQPVSGAELLARVRAGGGV